MKYYSTIKGTIVPYAEVNGPTDSHTEWSVHIHTHTHTHTLNPICGIQKNVIDELIYKGETEIYM